MKKIIAITLMVLTIASCFIFVGCNGHKKIDLYNLTEKEVYDLLSSVDGITGFECERGAEYGYTYDRLKFKFDANSTKGQEYMKKTGTNEYEFVGYVNIYESNEFAKEVYAYMDSVVDPAETGFKTILGNLGLQMIYKISKSQAAVITNDISNVFKLAAQK